MEDLEENGMNVGKNDSDDEHEIDNSEVLAILTEADQERRESEDLIAVPRKVRTTENNVNKLGLNWAKLS